MHVNMLFEKKTVLNKNDFNQNISAVQTNWMETLKMPKGK